MFYQTNENGDIIKISTDNQDGDCNDNIENVIGFKEQGIKKKAKALIEDFQKSYQQINKVAGATYVTINPATTNETIKKDSEDFKDSVEKIEIIRNISNKLEDQLSSWKNENTAESYKKIIDFNPSDKKNWE